MATLGKAIAIAATAFEGAIDKGGNPYILHCLWVMNAVRHLGEDYMIVAVLHDLLEDTDWTAERLVKEADFDPSLVKTIMMLTHPKGLSYEDYIRYLAHDEIARQVKLRDLEHNSKITRLKGLTKKDFDRLQKYNTAYTYLKSI